MNFFHVLRHNPQQSKRKYAGYDVRMMHPVREWLIGLTLFFFCVAVGGAVSTYTFLRYINVVVAEVHESQNRPVYNQILAEKAQNLYQGRTSLFSAYKTETPTDIKIASSSPLVSPVVEKKSEEFNAATTSVGSAQTEDTQLAN